MKRLLQWISLLFLILVVIFIIALLYTIYAEEPIIKQKPLDPIIQTDKPKQDRLWLDRLLDKKQRRYYFPVEEAYIRVDLIKSKKGEKPYELIVDDLDPYQLFCLKEELRRHRVRYYFRKTKERIKLLVYSKEIGRLRKLTQVLKRYQIDAKIQKR